MFTVDPRRTSSAEWADVWLGIDVGSDIALANAVGREIIARSAVAYSWASWRTTSAGTPVSRSAYSRVYDSTLAR